MSVTINIKSRKIVRGLSYFAAGFVSDTAFACRAGSQQQLQPSLS